jgi:2-polyprenyl-3-methyl-5-hydroxy-6-metoxy-1,4-benzoquinol methylase
VGAGRLRTDGRGGDGPTGPILVAAAGIGPGVQVLDVAAGSGNISLPAAKTGATVVSTDLTPELLQRSQARAAERGLTLDYQEANAQALPLAMMSSTP